MNRPLTERQKEVYEFYVEHTMEHGFQPTYREVMAHFGFGSMNSVNQYIRAIQNKGWWKCHADSKKKSLHIPEVIGFMKTALEQRNKR